MIDLFIKLINTCDNKHTVGVRLYLTVCVYYLCQNQLIGLVVLVVLDILEFPGHQGHREVHCYLGHLVVLQPIREETVLVHIQDQLTVCS